MSCSRTENFTKGTLVLDITERSSGSLVWRAMSDKRIGSKDVNQDRLDRLVENMTKSLSALKQPGNLEQLLAVEEGKLTPQRLADRFTAMMKEGRLKFSDPWTMAEAEGMAL